MKRSCIFNKVPGIQTGKKSYQTGDPFFFFFWPKAETGDLDFVSCFYRSEIFARERKALWGCTFFWPTCMVLIRSLSKNNSLLTQVTRLGHSESRKDFGIARFNIGVTRFGPVLHVGTSEFYCYIDLSDSIDHDRLLKLSLRSGFNYESSHR